MPVYLRQFARFSRDVRLVLLSSAIIGFCIMGINAVLLNLYILRLGYGPEFVGVVNATGTIASALFCLPASAIGQRIGSRKGMIAAIVLSASNYGLLSLAVAIPAAIRSPWMLITILLAQMGSALRITSLTPFLMGATGSENRNRVFSLLHAISPGAAFLGSLVGGQLPGVFARLTHTSTDTPAPYGLAISVAALLLILAIVAVLRTREVDLEERAATKAKLPAQGSRAPVALIAIMSLILMIRVAGDGSVRTFFNVYMDRELAVSTSLIGTITALGQLLAIPAALATPMLAERWGNRRTYVLAALGMAASILLLAVVPTWSAAAVGYIGMASLISLARPAVTVFDQSLVPPLWRPAMAGGTQMGVSVGLAAISLIGGYVIGTAGYRPLFLLGAGLVAAGALLFGAYFRTPRGEHARQREVETTT